jgi:hypothetical protein
MKGERDMTQTTQYGIERIGYGKRTRYTIRAYQGSGSVPADGGRTYRTAEAAQAAAERAGLTIAAVGDMYEIRAAIRQAALS